MSENHTTTAIIIVAAFLLTHRSGFQIPEHDVGTLL